MARVFVGGREECKNIWINDNGETLSDSVPATAGNRLYIAIRKKGTQQYEFVPTMNRNLGGAVAIFRVGYIMDLGSSSDMGVFDSQTRVPDFPDGCIQMCVDIKRISVQE